MNWVLFAGVAVIGLPIVFLKFLDQLGGALVVLLGIYFLGDSMLAERDMKALASAGQSAVVEPVGDSYTIVTRQRSGSKSYKARIAFQTASGQMVSEEADIPDAALDKFKTGQKATVTYLPSKPKLYRFNPVRAPNNDGILLSLGIILAGSLWIAFKRLTAGKPAKA